MRLLTAEEMRAADQHAIEKIGIPSLVLMENAGLKSLMTMEKILNGLKGKRFTIICGKGNNGGDGLVIARHLFNNDIAVHVFITAPVESLSQDATANLAILENSGLNPIFITDDNDINRLRIAMEFSECIVDCLYGTGVKGDIQGFHAKVIRAMNDSRAKKISIDLPSGLCATSGNASNPTFCADHTITLGAPKLGLFLFPGKSFCGELWIADIGLPAMSTASVKAGHSLITSSLARSVLPEREDTMHKGDAGKLIIIAGSSQYQGAGILSSYGALRSGAGIVTLALPQCIENKMVCQTLPELIVNFLPSSGDGHNIDAQQVTGMAANYRVMLVGPGLGRDKCRADSILNILENWTGTVILDADALNLIENPEILAKCPGKIIITPHMREMSRLCGRSINEISAAPIAITKDFAEKHQITVVMKSCVTVISDERGQIFINSRPNSGLARGGSGDLLSGLIAGLATTGLLPLNAAIAGVYLLSESAELAKEELGADSMTVSEVASFIPAAFKKLRIPEEN